MNAIYHYREYSAGVLIPRKGLVKIIKNDKKTYLVELMHFCGNKAPGELIRVRKKNISF
jgi:hypothetical protein